MLKFYEHEHLGIVWKSCCHASWNVPIRYIDFASIVFRSEDNVFFMISQFFKLKLGSASVELPSNVKKKKKCNFQLE